MIPLYCGNCVGGVGWSFGLFSSCWDGMNFLGGVLSGWIEMNFDDDVEGSDQSLGDSSRNQREE